MASIDLNPQDVHPREQTAHGSMWNRLRARIGPTELRRRIWHMAPGLLPFGLWPISHEDPISPILYGVILVVAVLVAGGIFLGYRRIQRKNEHGQRLSAVAGYAGSVLAALLLFPGDAEIGMAVLALLAFGDGSATFVGRLMDGPRLPWNPDKTVAGTLAFVLVGGLMASIVYWGESNNLEAVQPHAGPLTALLCGCVPALVAALAESVRSHVNDNIRVGVAALLAVACVHGALVGIS